MTNLPKQITDAAETEAEKYLATFGAFPFMNGVTWLWTRLLEAAPDKPKVLYAVWESAIAPRS